MIDNQYVICGVDGSAGARAALRFATTEAVLRGRPLRVLAAGDVPVAGAQVVHGDLAGALVDEARHAALIVVGRSSAGIGSPSAVLCRRVAAHAACPVIVTPADPSGAADSSVLVGLEIGEHDATALGFAFEEAALRRVPLIAAHVWAGTPPTALGAVDPFAYDQEQARTVVDRLLAEAVAGYAEKYPDVEVRRMPIYGVNPARALLRVSADVGLIVVGASRERFYSGQLLGTVTRTLLRSSACPIGIVQPGGRPIRP